MAASVGLDYASLWILCCCLFSLVAQCSKSVLVWLVNYMCLFVLVPSVSYHVVYWKQTLKTILSCIKFVLTRRHEHNGTAQSEILTSGLVAVLTGLQEISSLKVLWLLRHKQFWMVFLIKKQCKMMNTTLVIKMNIHLVRARKYSKSHTIELTDGTWQQTQMIT